MSVLGTIEDPIFADVCIVPLTIPEDRLTGMIGSLTETVNGILNDHADGIKVKKLTKLVVESNDSFKEEDLNALLSDWLASGKVIETGNKRISINMKGNSTKKRKRAASEDDMDRDGVREEGRGHTSHDGDHKTQINNDKKIDKQREKDKIMGGEPEDVVEMKGHINEDSVTSTKQKSPYFETFGKMEKNTIERIYLAWTTFAQTLIKMKDPKSAITAVLQDQTKFMGRPLKIYYCPPRPGDVWPPLTSSHGHDKQYNPKNQINELKKAQKTEKPAKCRKLFIGNLSYDIDDDTIVDFFKDCGELIGLRWLYHIDTGKFRGGGYVEFAKTEDADKAFLLDGKKCC